LSELVLAIALEQELAQTLADASDRALEAWWVSESVTQMAYQASAEALDRPRSICYKSVRGPLISSRVLRYHADGSAKMQTLHDFCAYRNRAWVKNPPDGTSCAPLQGPQFWFVYDFVFCLLLLIHLHTLLLPELHSSPLNHRLRRRHHLIATSLYSSPSFLARQPLLEETFDVVALG
jgi:hypothetical protein